MIWIGDEDLPLLAERGVVVVHNPESNVRGGNQALHHSLRLATILSRPHEPRIADWVLARELGAIAPGYRADVVLYDLKSPWWTPLNDPVHQLVYSETGSSVDTVVIDGRLVMENGRVLTFDADEVLRESRAAFPRILQRNASVLDLARRLADAAL
ncbi:MAG: hypothetical protein ACT4P4_21680 [Betaproteobacteria bacterium]